jgi:hypothetical protein
MAAVFGGPCELLRGISHLAVALGLSHPLIKPYLLLSKTSIHPLPFWTKTSVLQLPLGTTFPTVISNAVVERLVASNGGRRVRHGNVGGQLLDDLALIKTDPCTYPSNQSTHLLRWLKLQVARGRSRGMSLDMLEC